MASTTGIAPLFTSAPRIKIVINDIDIAFAIGLNLNVSIDVQPVQILGKFGPVSLEPTMYNIVTGTMQIIRLSSAITDTQTITDLLQGSAAGASRPRILTTGPTTAGGQETSDSVTTAVADFATNSALAQNALIRHMDPRTVLLSQAFNLDLFLKIPDANNSNTKLLLNSLTSDDPSNLSETQTDHLTVSVPWMRVVNCRITSRNVNIAMGQLVNEPVSFQGLYLTTKTTAGDDIMRPDAGATPNSNLF